jgi:hypothetical protein
LPLGDGTKLAAVKGITGGDVAAIIAGQAAGNAALGLPLPSGLLDLPELPDLPTPSLPSLPTVPGVPDQASNESNDIGGLLGSLFGR